MPGFGAGVVKLSGLSLLQGTADRLEAWSRSASWVSSWAIVAMVLVQFAVVVLRYIFGYGLVWIQESILYLHALAFIFAAGHTLAVGGHVRVDVFYRGFSPRMRAGIDVLGSLLFLMPFLGIVGWTALPYVSSSWSILEGSRETAGIPALFILKTLILVLAALLALQGTALFLRSMAIGLGLMAGPSSSCTPKPGA